MGGRLQFDEQIAPKQGKPIAVNELLRRLKALHSELVTIDQDEVVRESLTSVSQELVARNLLLHKDRGVKAYSACCMAEILRLHAPDAPYTVSQLREIFEFFVAQLQGLENRDSTYFEQYFGLLESLATVKSIILVSDLPNCEDLISQIFRMFFDIIKPESPKNVEFFMCEILVQLVDEATTIPTEVLDYILAQFLRAKTANASSQSSKDGIVLSIPPAYNMAKQVCQSCSDRLQRYVGQYFSDVIYEASTNNSGESSKIATDEDLQEIQKAHSLVRELWRASPMLLSSVIPQIEQEMLVENVDLRALATEVIGAIAWETIGGVNFSLEYQSTMVVWLKRANDKSPIVRCKWVECCVGILNQQPNDIKALTDALASKLVDIDEKVRVAACAALSALNYTTITLKLGESILSNLADRIKDRKHTVRAEGMKVLGKYFNLAYPKIAVEDESTVRLLGWIPRRIFECYYVNDQGINMLLDRVIFDQLLTFDNDNDVRAERLLWIIHSLDAKSKKAFYAVPRKQVIMSQVVSRFVDLCVEQNGSAEDLSSELLSAMLWLAKGFPDPTKAQADLMKLLTINDRRMYKLIRECIRGDSEFVSVKKAIREIVKRLGQASSSVVDTWTSLLYRSSLLMFNKSNIPVITSFSHRRELTLAPVAQEVLKEMSIVTPFVFKSHVDELVDSLSHDISENLPERADALKTLCSFVRSFPDELPQNRSLLHNLFMLATQGSQQEAKQASTILLLTQEGSNDVNDLLIECKDFGTSDPHLTAKLSTLGCFFLNARDECENAADSITNMLIKDILLISRAKRVPDENEWEPDENLDRECQAKVLAIRALVNRLRVNPERSIDDDLAEPVLKLLNSLVANAGELSKDESTPLRLEAGKSLLKLAGVSKVSKMITPIAFNRMALLVQDTCYQVRQSFIRKLMKLLSVGKLPSSYYTMIFLMAFEPEEEVREEVTRWARARADFHRSAKTFTLENIFPRLLALLAHHPDMSTDVEDLSDFARYIAFYLHPVATKDSLALIYYLAQRVKQSKDALNPDHSENLYILSELAQNIIRRFEEAHGWSMQSWPGKLGLSIDLFAALPSSEQATEIARQMLLPPEINEKLNGIVKATTNGLGKKRKTHERKEMKAWSVQRKSSKVNVSKKPKIDQTPPSERRRSGRQRPAVNYEASDDGISDGMEYKFGTGSDKEN